MPAVGVHRQPAAQAKRAILHERAGLAAFAKPEPLPD